MANVTWRKVVEDSAVTYRDITGETSKIKVGELAGKIDAMNTAKFVDSGITQIAVDPDYSTNIHINTNNDAVVF